MIYYDTTTKQLLTYANGKWQADRSTATKIVGTSASGGANSAVASVAPDGADYVNTSTTSAQTVINSAISSLPASGGTVYLMEGTYIVDGSITLPNNITLVGSGPGTVLKLKNGINADASLITNSDTTIGNQGITVKDIRLDGNKANNASGYQAGIYFIGVGRPAGSLPSVIEALTVENFRNSNIYLGDGGGSNYGTIVKNVTARNSSTFGLEVSTQVNLLVTNSTFTGNTTRGIYLSSSQSSVISSNIIKNSGTEGIALSNVTKTTVTQNIIESNTQAGISVSLSSDNTISANRLYDNTGASNISSIYVGNDSDNNTVIANSITDTAGTGYAIQVADVTSDTNYLADNIFSGTGAATINDTGTGTIYSNQLDASGNLINRSQGGGFTVGKTTANASLSLQGSLVATQLTVPTLSATVTNVGTAGTTTYRYQVTALDGMGETTGSTIQETTTGNATLSSTNYNTISWSAVGGASQYRIYRCTGAACTPALLTTVAGNTITYNDQAAGAPSGAVPTTNTTGGSNVAGAIQGGSSATLGTTTVAGSLAISDGSSNTATILVASTAGNYTYTIPVTTANDTFCLVTLANCAASPVTLQGAYDNDGSGVADIITTSAAKTLLFKAGAGFDAAALLDIQNAASQSILSVDSRNGTTINLFGTTTGEPSSWSTNASALPAGRTDSTSVTANGYVYLIGGRDSSNVFQATVYYAKLNSDGSTGAWTTNTNALPAPRDRATSVVANGYVYVIGGTTTGGVHQSTVYYAKLNPDGSIGTWQTSANSLPNLRYSASSVTANGYVYVIGGYNGTVFQNTVYYAKLNAGGNIGTWATAANVPPAVRYAAKSVTANGYVYVIGGYNSANAPQSTVYYAALNADGSVGAWSTNANALPAVRVFAGSVIANGHVYVLGGNDNSSAQSTIYYAKLNANGGTGSWSTANNALPVALQQFGSVIANGYVYAIGGFTPNTLPTTTYFSRLGGTLRVGGSLDLVGIQGQNLADGGDSSLGSTSGSITAGNITSVGTLQIQGAANFASTASVTGDFNAGNGIFSVEAGNTVATLQVKNPNNNILLAVSSAQQQLQIGTASSFDTTPTKLANPATLPTGNGTNTAWSPDGVYVTISHVASPYITIYKRSGDTFTKLADPATLPTGTAEDVAWSPDGVYMTVAHVTTPYITIYKRSGDTFTKLANPATLPAGDGYATGWSPDGVYMSVAHNNSPYFTIYKRSGDTFTKLADPATLPPSFSTSTAWSPDGQYMVAGHGSSPYITIYKRSGDTFTKLADPATLPANGGNNTAWSPDGQYMSVAHSITPFITIYKRSGDTFTKLADPASLPASTGFNTAWSPDGQYMSVGHDTSPYITIYKRSGDTFTKLADPASLPTGRALGSAWSPDGQYMSVAHLNSPYVTIYKGTAGQRVNMVTEGNTSVNGSTSVTGLLQASTAAFSTSLFVAGNTTLTGSSTALLAVQNSTGTNLLNIDTTNNLTTINSGLVLSTYSWSRATETGVNSYTDTTKAASYVISSNSTTTDSSFTTTMNLTGLGTAEGTVVYVDVVAIKGATAGSRTHTTLFQIGGTTISTVATATGTGASTIERSFIVMRINGAWKIVGTGLTAAPANNVSTVNTADFAEWIRYSGDEQPQPGDVLVVGSDATSVKKSESDYHQHILGVVSTDPYQVAGADDGHSVIIALTGRVPVKVSMENGPINKGDLLTSSSVPGVAMKALRAGKVIGMALSDYDGTQPDNLVTVQLQVGYDTPEVDTTTLQGSSLTLTEDATIAGSVSIGATLNVSGATNLSSLTVTGNAVVQGNLQVVGDITTQNITVNGHIITGGTAPEVAPGTGVGVADDLQNISAPVVTIEGNDTSGTITIVAGTNTTADELARLTFATEFGGKPRVTLTAANRDSTKLGIYYDSTTATQNSFSIMSDIAPEAGKTYTFTYFVVQ